MNGFHIMHEEDATRYEIHVSRVNSQTTGYHEYYVVSLLNFGECFAVSNLNYIAEHITKKSNIFSRRDAINIQNGIAKKFDGVDFVEFDRTTGRIVLG